MHERRPSGRLDCTGLLRKVAGEPEHGEESVSVKERMDLRDSAPCDLNDLESPGPMPSRRINSIRIGVREDSIGGR
jgi:hypothetical protein